VLWEGRVARMRGNIKACGVFVGKPEGKDKETF